MQDPMKVSGHSLGPTTYPQPRPILVPTRVVASSALAVDAAILAKRGLSPAAIAATLGVTRRHVDRLLGQQR